MSNGYRIVRLQVQRSPVKIGKAPLRDYQPATLVPVDSIEAGPRGVTGVTADGERVLDVHHQDHPHTRDRRGRAGILFMGTGDYTALRERYGEHLLDGIAGETLLLDAPEGLAGRRIPERVTVRTATGPVELHGVRVAEPCVEFSKFCLRQPMSPVVDDAVKATLIDLDGGARGYRAIAAGQSVIAAGDIIEL